MNTALNIIEEVEAQGCELETDGERVSLKAAHPLPGELVERLKENKAEVIICLTRRWIERHDRSGAYLRAIPGSVTRPGDFNSLAHDYRRTWQAAVYWFMVEDEMERLEAEEKAWGMMAEGPASNRRLN